MTKIFLVKLDSSTIQTVEEQFFFSHLKFRSKMRTLRLRKGLMSNDMKILVHFTTNNWYDL